MCKVSIFELILQNSDKTVSLHNLEVKKFHYNKTVLAC